MAKPGLRKVHRYTDEFKATAVKLSSLPEVRIQDVADALDIHPFMLSRWRKDYREGRIVAKKVKLDEGTAAELKRLTTLERTHALLTEEHALLKKSHPVLFRTKKEIFAFIDRHQGEYRVTVMCRLYGVTRAGYSAWRHRSESPRRQHDRTLLEKIRMIHAGSRKTYGSPRIHRALRGAGECVGKKRVARIMRENGLKARSAALYHANPGTHAFFASIPNRGLDRVAAGPDQVWVGDITYVKVATQWRYLAVVMDKYSRRIVGWSLDKQKDATLTLAALNHAVSNRRPRPGVIFHTDRGIEYAAYVFRTRLAHLGFTQSMTRPGEMTDNAHMESFFHSMKSDVIHGVAFDRDAELTFTVRRYIPFYNQARLHSSLDYLPPVVYENIVA